MVQSIYTLAETLGFTHPLHPILVHIPMGMIIGMVLFSIFGMVRNNQVFAQTAFHCCVLALLFVVPVIIAGILDWQQFQLGEWSNLIIIKMILGVALTGLLVLAVILKLRDAAPSRLFLVYLLCLACAGGLGYAGGELVYG